MAGVTWPYHKQANTTTAETIHIYLHIYMSVCLFVYRQNPLKNISKYLCYSHKHRINDVSGITNCKGCVFVARNNARNNAEIYGNSVPKGVSVELLAEYFRN